MQIFILSMTYFLASLAELMPSGVLSIIADDMDIGYEIASQLIGVYAIGAAISSIPIARASLGMNRKLLLSIILLGFSLSTLGIALINNFKIALIFRLIGGLCAGAFWPMIPNLAVKIAPAEKKGNAITTAAFGSAIATFAGMPLFTRIGRNISWQAEFITYAGLAMLVLILVFFFIPSVEGEESTDHTTIPSALRNTHLKLILLMTLFIVVAHYGLYTYNNALFKASNYQRSIDTGLFIFGLGSVLSVLAQIRFITNHLRTYFISILALGVFALGLFIFGPNSDLILNIALFLWGASFGGYTAVLSTTLSRRIQNGTSIAMSIQTFVFDASIMLATALGAIILKQGSVLALTFMSFIGLILGLAIAVMTRLTFSNKK